MEFDRQKELNFEETTITIKDRQEKLLIKIEKDW
jgi:hypothetical protein